MKGSSYKLMFRAALKNLPQAATEELHTVNKVGDRKLQFSYRRDCGCSKFQPRS